MVAALESSAVAGEEDGADAPAPIVYATATVRERPVDSATAQVTVIDRETIEALDARTLGELLRFVPGVDVTGNGSRGGLATARIRGGDPNFTLVLIDGVAVNDGTYQVGEVFNLEGLATAAIERVEIVRGPLSAFYGATGLAGAVHVITRRAPPDGHRFSVEVGAGDASYRAAHGDFAGATPRADYFVALSAEEEDERIAAESFRLLQLQGRGGVDLGGSSRLELAGRLARWDGDDYPEASGGPLFGSGELRRAANSELSLGAEVAHDRRGRRQVVKAAYYRHQMERASPAVFPLVPESQEDTAFTRARLGWSLSLRPWDSLELSLGVDVEREEGRNRSVLLLPPFLGGAVPGDYEIARTTAGSYAELVARRGRWVFELGARIDDPSDGGLQANQRLGLSRRLSDGSRLRASAGRAFKLPGFFALASPPQLGGNRDLRPEVVRGADVGLESRFSGGRIETGVGLFYSRYSDLVDFDFDTFAHVNRSRVEARGVEGRLSWQPGRRFGLAVNLTRQEVEDLDSGRPLRERPKWVGGLRIDFRPLARLALHLHSQGVSERFDQQIPVPELDRVAGYQIWSATVSWLLAGDLRLRARLDNLTDRDFQTQIGFPGAGRSFRLGLRYASGEGETRP